MDELDEKSVGWAGKMRIHTRVVVDMASGAVLEDCWYEYAGPVARCDRSAQKQAANAETTAATTAGNYGGAAAGIGAKLTPTLFGDVNHPQGFSADETNNMLVAGEQGAGGANAGIAGQAGLQAARTRNTGNLGAVLDAAARAKGQQLSQNAVNVQEKSAQLAQQKRADALRKLQGLYGTNVGAQMKGEEIEPEDINAEVNAGKSGWLQNAMGVLGTLTGGAKNVMGGLYGSGGAFGG